MGSGVYLRSAIKKYGRENFKKEVLFIFETEQQLFSKETELVTEEFCTRDDTYNLKLGGAGSVSEHLLSTRKKMSLAHKGKYVTAETRARMSKAFTGRVYSESSRKKMSDSAKIRRERDKEFYTGRTHTEEVKKKMSIIQKQMAFSKGSKWYNNGQNNVKVMLGGEVPEGYFLGRIMPRKYPKDVIL